MGISMKKKNRKSRSNKDFKKSLMSTVRTCTEICAHLCRLYLKSHLKSHSHQQRTNNRREVTLPSWDFVLRHSLLLRPSCMPVLVSWHLRTRHPTQAQWKNPQTSP